MHRLQQAQSSQGKGETGVKTPTGNQETNYHPTKLEK